MGHVLSDLARNGLEGLRHEPVRHGARLLRRRPGSGRPTMRLVNEILRDEPAD